MLARWIVKKLRSKDQRSLELRLILQSAAVLKGQKESTMFFLCNQELRQLSEELKASKLHFYILHSCQNKNLVLIYRKEALWSYLSQGEVFQFLIDIGYIGNTIETFLIILRKRVSIFYGKEQNFPHEIGLFLGYPLCDVEGFFVHQGREFLFSGYWKIYDNLEYTLKRFSDFDKAKQEAISEWYAGKRLCEIACC